MKLILCLQIIVFLKCFSGIYTYQRNITAADLIPISRYNPRGLNPSLARHHIIPVSTLRDFYAAAFTLERPSSTSGRREGKLHFESFIKNVTVEARDRLNTVPYNQIKNIRNKRDLLDSAVLHAARLERGDHTAYDNSTDEYDVWLTVFVLLPGNLVVGPEPKLRDDDPGAGLDRAVLRFKDDQTLFKDLYEYLSAYIANRKVRNVKNKRQGTPLDIIVDLLNTLNNKYVEMIQFQRDSWGRINIGGKWFVNI